MIRSLHAELVDDLPADHPAAIKTRRDLQLLNTLMGHTGILARSLKEAFPNRPASRILEIGAGDGELLRRVARRLTPKWNDVEVVFVDLKNLLGLPAKAEFAALGWGVQAVEADVFQWLKDTAGKQTDVIIANLVLHHFSDDRLSDLFSTAAERCDAFIAIEPRRSAWPLFWTRRLSLIGCGPVTCHDAPVSVQAGFTNHELSQLWPTGSAWKLTERSAGLFSHLFVAQRKR